MAKVLFEVQGDPSPLAFTCPAPLTVENLHRNFPIPGKWHFRAKQTAPGVADYVWMDLTEPGRIPSYQGVLYVKAYPVEQVPGSYEETDDAVPVTGGEDPGAIPIQSEVAKGDHNVPRPPPPKPSESKADPIKEATSGISNMFGRALASSAKAMEQMRKKLDESM